MSDTNTRGHGKVVRSGLMLGVAKIITQGCSFGRNILIARVIGRQSFGVAATFSLTISMLEWVGSLSVDKLLIQAKDGDDKEFQAVAHSVQALRGLISGLLIAAFAWPLAHLFRVPEATWAFACLGLVPAFRGLMHLDAQRMQRVLSYRAGVTIEVTEQLLTTLLAWPLALWLKDYTTVLWLLVAQSIFAVTASRLVARRRYAWSWDPEYVKRFFRFGWPLIVNSLLVFGIFQGDRLLIGSAKSIFEFSPLSLADLADYSAAVSLTLAPTLAVANICSSLLLPIFSRLQSDPAGLHRRYAFCSQIIGLLSGLFVLPCLLCGRDIVRLLYGPEYAAAGEIVGWLAAAQAVRLARITPTIAAMAKGDTGNSLIANLYRALALLGVVVVIASRGSLRWVALCGLAGEILAWGVGVWRLQRLHGVPVILSLRPLGVVSIPLVLAALATLVVPAESSGARLAVALGLAGGLGVLMNTVFPSLALQFRPRPKLEHSRPVGVSVTVVATKVE